MGKSSIDTIHFHPFSMAMLVTTRGYDELLVLKLLKHVMARPNRKSTASENRWHQLWMPGQGGNAPLEARPQDIRRSH